MMHKRLDFSLTATLATSLALLVLSSSAVSADNNDCRSIDDAAARLACYDRLNAPTAEPTAEPTLKPQQAAPQQVEETVTAVEIPAVTAEPATTEPAALDDSVGKERIADRRGEDEVRFSGRVTSCRKEQSGKYRFYFDNGQIWLQKDNKRVPWSECDFVATIEKDFFGYKMLPQGEKRTIRISRIK